MNSKTVVSAGIVGVPTITATCVIIDVYGTENRLAVSESSEAMISVGGTVLI